MADKKVIHKNESLEFSTKDYFDIILGWDECVNANYDLCVFFRKKDKSTGGVFAREFCRKQSEGTLREFPYIYFMSENRPQYDLVGDVVRITNLHSMDEVYLVALDYDAFLQNKNGFDISVILETTGTNPLIKMDYSKSNHKHGTVLFLATLKETDKGDIIITNKSELMSIEDAFEEIPGFSHICTQ